MKPLLDMYHFIFLAAWVTSGGCWPTFEAEQTLQPRGSYTTKNSTISSQTVELSRTINTTLAISMFMLVVVTYSLLMKYTTTLSNEIILPSKLLEDNIAAVLSLTWPEYLIKSQGDRVDPSQKDKIDQSQKNEIDQSQQDKVYQSQRNRLDQSQRDKGVQFQENIFDLSLPWVLFYRGDEILLRNRQFSPALGFRDVKKITGFPIFRKRFMATIKAFSPIMKSLVQVAIWNSVSFWLVVIMVVNTLVYDGFMSHNITRDSAIRLVLVLIYALANFGHQYRATTLLYRNFTFVLFQACWTLISRVFIFPDCVNYEDFSEAIKKSGSDRSDILWTSLNLELFGTTERSVCYQTLESSDKIGCEAHTGFTVWPTNDKRWDSLLKVRDKTECKFDKFIKPVREAEIMAYEKATDSALEKALANVAVLLGICLATALAPWTSTQTIDATGAQLGSYALLLSISTGLLALVSSISQLTNATESAKTLLLLQEQTIEAAKNLEIEDMLGEGGVSDLFSFRYIPRFGFSKGIAGESRLTFFGLWQSTSFFGKLFCLLFGPASILIPRFHGDRQSFEKTHSSMTDLFFKVKDITFGYIIFGFDLDRDILPRSIYATSE